MARVARFYVAAILIAAMAAFAIPVGSARSQALALPAAKPVSIELVQFKVVVGSDGRERFIDARAVAPGDIIEYRATYRNVSRGPVSRLVASLPIPQGLSYIPGSASPVGARFALAANSPSETFGVEPLMRPGPNGQQVQVPYNLYRVAHWVRPRLEANAAFVIKLRAKVPTVGSARPVDVKLPSKSRP